MPQLIRGFLLTALILTGCARPEPVKPVEKPPVPSAPPVPVVAPSWKVLGPGGGGSHFACTVSPFNPDIVFSKCDMSGAQVTYDGGRSWRMFNLRTVIYDFEFDPADSNTVYASNTGLYRSENLGRSWRLIYPDPADIIAERMVGDHAEQYFETKSGMPDGLITQVLVDPSDSRRIVIGLDPPGGVDPVKGPFSSIDSVRILVSSDRGAQWSLLARLPGREVLALFPGAWEDQPDQVKVLTDRSCYQLSFSGGAAVELGLPEARIRAADGGKGKAGAIYYVLSNFRQAGARAEGGIYRSTDGGHNWSQVSRGLLEDWQITAQLPYFKTLAVCESRPEVVYLSAHIYIDEIEWMPNRPKRDRKFGIFKTDNAGDAWRWVYRASEDSIYSRNFRGGWEDQSYGPEWGESPHSFGVSPADPDICYVTDNRTYVTRDGGKRWEQVYTEKQPDGSWRSRGIDVTTTYGVHFDPFDRNHLFISYTDIGLWHSFNGGKSWFHALKGIPREWINTTYWLVFDPEVKDRIWTVRSDCHDLPRLKMFRSGAIARGEYQGGVAVSGDGGKSWQVSSSGIPPNSVCTHILLDPESPAGMRTLYVCAMERGVYKSVDDGKTWIEANSGLGERPSAWRIERSPEGMLYLLVVRSIKDGKVVDGGLFHSDSGATSWQPVALPKGVTGPNDLLCDPRGGGIMYLSCWPYPLKGQESGGGLLRTEDGGVTWQRVFDEQAHVYAAALDPQNPDIVFINTFDSAAFRSEDRGATWHGLPGYNFKWGHRPVPDPRNPHQLYLTTFGGSVFYGPAKGVAEAKEDIEDGTYLRWAGMN